MVLNYSLCVGLYAYLRQIELSLDRCIPTNIEEVKNYFLLPEMYQPASVANYFESLIQVKEDFLFIDHSTKRHFSRFFGKNKLLLKRQDMLTIITCLYDVDRLINSKHSSPHGLIDMRVLINRVSWDLIGSKLCYKFRLKAHSVEHYHQNEYLTFKSIDNILGDKWLA
jgi:hypothetical protein